MNTMLRNPYLEITEPRLITIEKHSAKCNTFVYGPLVSGYAVTFGNSIRRILLSSIPGCGLVYLHIHGISHLCSTIPHVKEDVIEIIERLKQITFRINSEIINSKEILIDVGAIMKSNKDKDDKSFVLTSGMLPKYDVVEILNNVPICTVCTDSIDLKMSLLVEKGFGYLDPNAMQRIENIPHGYIPINNTISAVKRVRVDNPPPKTVHGEFTSYENLKIEIETDGSITPWTALKQALTQMKSILSAMEYSGNGSEKDKASDTISRNIIDIMQRPITDLPIKEAIIRTLHSAGITEIAHLCALNKEQALKIPRLGVTKVELIQKALQSINLSFQAHYDYNNRSHS